MKTTTTIIVIVAIIAVIGFSSITTMVSYANATAVIKRPDVSPCKQQNVFKPNGGANAHEHCPKGTFPTP